ncbi:MAG: FtsX-like permease family protein [Clostridia bacterium]|nr:FtsX-like permease family protein [Clostridia bacterium]
MKINKILITDAIRTIERTSPRFISIIAIVALGISFFAGMNATAPDMYDTMAQYMDTSNSMDIQIVSTAGITDNDIAVISSINGVEAAVGEKYVDGVVKVAGETVSDIDGSEMTIRAISLDINKVINCANGYDDPTYLNRPELVSGNWPTSSNQCLVDESFLSTPEEFKIGSVITIEGDGTDITGSLRNTQFTIVGIIRTPLYISYERGNTTVGTGKLGTFCYLPSENFLNAYYTSMSVKLQDSEKHDPYSEEYADLVKSYTDYIESISGELLSSRVDALKAEYTVKVADSEAEYASTKAQVELSLAEGEAQVAQILDMAENGDANLIKYKQEYNEKATEAANKIDSSKLEHSTQYAAWEDKRNKYNEAKAKVDEYAGAETQLANAQTEYNVASLQVETMLSTVSYLENLLATTRSAMDQFNNTQDSGVQGIVDRFAQSGLVGEEVDQIISTINGLTAVGTAEEMMAYMEPQLQTLEVRLASSKQELTQAKTVLAEKKVELEEAEKLVAKLKEVEATLSTAELELAEAEKELTNAGYDIQLGELEVLSQLSDMKNQITTYETNVIMAKEKAKTIEAEFQAAKNEANDRLEMARNQLDDAQQFLLGLDNARWYVQNRDDCLMGYEEYEQTAKRTAAISLVFPWFFFIVAALVCLNTMTRMIEEERTRLGTFKALGFTDSEIMFKYLVYAALASTIGSVAGSFMGFALFPVAVTTAYTILFDVPNVIISYQFGYAIPGILISIASTVLVTYYTCRKSLTVVPSTLMRSKAPKGGKRVFLEKIPFIWSRLSFTWKVTFRNVFRNMKRFIMATLGVAGCTALLLAGFGLNDSIDTTIQKQFLSDDRVWNYDMQIVLNGSYDTTIQECKALNIVNEKAAISTAMLNYMKVYDTTSDSSDDVLETYLLVPEDAAALGSYINLQNRKSGEIYTLTNNGAIITEKLADSLNIDVNDSITVIVDDGRTVQIPVAAITENYAFHYIYLSKDLYSMLFSANPRYNYIAANLAIDNMEQEKKNELAKELMSEYEISAVAYTSQIQNTFENIMDSVSAIVIIFIISAGLLAFIVLYNLSIINITERLKEIATIKVLGFDDGEVSSYIFRENIILTVIGIIEGLIAGIFIHRIVLYMAEVDILMFGRQISAMSFLYAAALAFAFSMFVSLVLHNKLKKVDMVESLKSVE